MAKTPDERRADKAAYMKARRAAEPEKYKALGKAFRDKHLPRLQAERRERYAANKHDIQARRHGVTSDLVAALRAVQGGTCAICDKPLAEWPSPQTHVDHCHDTGVVRGLLCRSCNMKEGWVRRYGERLKTYLDNPPAKAIQEFA